MPCGRSAKTPDFRSVDVAFLSSGLSGASPSPPEVVSPVSSLSVAEQRNPRRGALNAERCGAASARALRCFVTLAKFDAIARPRSALKP